MTDGLVRSALFWINAVPRPDSACGNDPPLVVLQGFRATLARHGKFKFFDNDIIKKIHVAEYPFCRSYSSPIDVAIRTMNQVNRIKERPIQRR